MTEPNDTKKYLQQIARLKSKVKDCMQLSKQQKKKIYDNKKTIAALQAKIRGDSASGLSDKTDSDVIQELVSKFEFIVLFQTGILRILT